MLEAFACTAVLPHFVRTKQQVLSHSCYQNNTANIQECTLQYNSYKWNKDNSETDIAHTTL